MTRCLILSARQFSIVDEDKPQSAPFEGVSISYLDLTSPVVPSGPASRSLGVDVFNLSAPKEIWGDLATLPGVFDVDFGMRPGKGGRPSLQVRGLHFVAPFALTETNSPLKKP